MIIFFSKEDDDPMNFMTRKWMIKNFWNKSTVKIMRVQTIQYWKREKQNERRESTLEESNT